ncbi:hypothetical protein NUM3379_24560 [Kineococcus sp. NUM-3379]
MPRPPAARARSTRTGTAVLAGIGALVLLPPTASAAPSLTFVRIEGANRYETAANASAATFPAGRGGTVVLASGTSTVDALAASAVAGADGAPVLLTRPGDVPAETLAELRRLGATRVVLAGGEGVIGPEVATRLSLSHTVTRAGGANRYDTAARLAALVGGAPGTVFVASAPADAVAVSPVAAAEGWPVLLTAPGRVPAETRAALAANPGARVVVVGGEGAVTPATAAALGADLRLAGADRFATAARIADFATTDAGFTGADVGLALGVNGPDGHDLADALAAGPVLARTGAPLLLTAGPDRLGAATEAHLSRNSTRLTGRATVFGGTAAVGPGAVAAAVAAAGAPGGAPSVVGVGGLRQGSAAVRVTFSEPVTGFTAADVRLAGAAAGAGVGAVTAVDADPATGAAASWDVPVTGGLGAGTAFTVAALSVVDRQLTQGPATAYTAVTTPDPGVRPAPVPAAPAPTATGDTAASYAGLAANGALTVTWAEPAPNGATITGYRVALTSGPAGFVPTEHPTLAAGARTDRFTGLGEGDYTVSVTALTAGGSSPAGTTTTTVGLDLPDAQQAVFTDPAGGTANVFGDENGERIVVTFDRAVNPAAFPDGSTFSIDPDGFDGFDAPVPFGIGSNLTAAVASNAGVHTVTFTIVNEGPVTADAAINTITTQWASTSPDVEQETALFTAG